MTSYSQVRLRHYRLWRLVRVPIIDYFFTFSWCNKFTFLISTANQGHQFPGIHGNRGTQNSRREFPGISEILARELRGILRSFVFFSYFYCWLWNDISLFNLMHCIMCTSARRTIGLPPEQNFDVFDQTFCVYRVPVYFQILISIIENHQTASEFSKLISLHEWGRWDK